MIREQSLIEERVTPRSKGWYYGWNIIAVFVLEQISANGLPVNAFSLFLRRWSIDLHATISSLQLAMLCLATMTALVAPFIGTLADRLQARWLIGCGVLGMAAFCFAVSFVTAAWQLLVLYGAVLPVTLALSTSIVTTAVVSRWFVRRSGVAFGLAAFGVGMAGVLTPPLIAAAMPLMGWRGIWRIAAVLLSVVIAPLVMIVLRDRPTEREGFHYLQGDVAHGASVHGSDERARGDLRWREVLRHRNYWLLVAVFVPLLATYGGCAYNLGPIVAQRGFGTQTAGLLLSVFSFTHVIATLLMGLASDRFGNRLPLACLAVIATAGAVLLGIGHTFMATLIAVALIGLAGGLWPLVTTAVAREFGSANAGLAFGMLLVFLPIQAFSSFVIARTEEITGSYALGFVSYAVLVFVGGTTCLLMRERSMAPSIGSSASVQCRLNYRTHRP